MKRREFCMNRAEIERLIKEEDVEFIRLQFTDMFGNLKNLAVTPGQLDKVFQGRYGFESSTLFNDVTNLDEKLYLRPDPDSFVILPWRPQQGKVAKFICDVVTEDGELFNMAPRTILKKVLDEASKEGYSFTVDPECEFFLFHTDDNGAPTVVTHEQAGYMDVGPVDFGENARRDMVLTLEEMGFEIESSHHEKAPGQHEIDFKEAEALQTADAIVTFKFAVRSIAKRFGLYATFMPKPSTGVAGSGMHLNITMYGKDGKNMFRGEGKEPNENARYFMAGIMNHAKGIAAITNPIVNSYKRLVSGFQAPKFINWSTNGEESLIKYNKNFDDAGIEVRFPDPSANPYLAIALLISAGIDGIKNKMDPGDEDRNGAGKRHQALPENLKDAVTDMKKDPFARGILGDEFTDIYMKAKREEWNDYMDRVSDWEINRYLGRM